MEAVRIRSRQRLHQRWFYTLAGFFFFFPSAIYFVRAFSAFWSSCFT